VISPIFFFFNIRIPLSIGTYLNLACRGLEEVWSGDLFGGERGEVSPSSARFSSSSL